MAKYRKKPVVIDAFEWRDGVCFPMPEFAGLHDLALVSDDSKHLNIKTLEGIPFIRCHCLILKSVNGEFYPCKPDIFEKTYESVEEGTG